MVGHDSRRFPGKPGAGDLAHAKALVHIPQMTGVQAQGQFADTNIAGVGQDAGQIQQDRSYGYHEWCKSPTW